MSTRFRVSELRMAYDLSSTEVRKVVSGGQTGVDRAALDAAMAVGLEVGGWCPKGRRAEDGPIDGRYPLQETPLEDYEQRTAWNVRDSDATLILSAEKPYGGTASTIEEARRVKKPYLVVDPSRVAVETVRSWLRQHEIRTLNVAGPRDRPDGGIYAAAYAFLRKLLVA